MYERKEHDWILENINNPDFTNTEFKMVGLSPDNVSIGSKSMYELSSTIRENPAFQTDGKFNQTKFDLFYNLKLQLYNDLAKDTSEDDIAKNVSFYKYNVFAPVEKIRLTPDTLIIKTGSLFNQNPNRTSVGFTDFNLESPTKWTPEELAQMNPIYDPKTGEFTKYTAEESLFKDFFKPAVLATWDFNADINGNPTNNESEIYYQKGLPKINPETGTYYYEYTDGPTYGKQVLSKWNILTKERGDWNKYDFFDSDDKQKSPIGSFMRNAVMLLPYALGPEVATAYMGMSIALGLTNTLATLGKMAIGSDNKFLSNVENFNKSLSFTSSQYAQEHTWSAENILNLTGSTFEFLKNMLLMAKRLPKLFGKEYVDPENTIARNNWIENRTKLLIADGLESTKKNPRFLTGNLEGAKEYSNTLLVIQEGSVGLAETEFNNMIQNYQKLGEQISRAYMAVSFGTETYGEAKMQGASDAAATALTLGSIAGQYALLSSHIGNWIMPNRLEELRTKKIGEKLLAGGDATETINKTLPENINFFKKWFLQGKSLATDLYTPAQTATAATTRGMLASGIEMTSFEVLRDLTASVYNLANHITGQDGHMEAFNDGDISKLLDRYGSTFFGGALAGVMFAPKRNFDYAKSIHNMTYELAVLQAIYLAKEGKLDKVKNEIRKLPEVGIKSLSDFENVTLPNGEKLYSLGSENDNLDITYKNRIIEWLDNIENILRSNNLLISDDVLLSKLTDLAKFYHLRHSKVIGSYTLNFLSAITDVVKYSELIRKYNSTLQKQEENRPDKSDRENPKISEKLLEDYQIKLNEALKRANKFIDGTYSKDYVLDATFDMSPLINNAYLNNTFESFALAEEGVDTINDISESRIEELKKRYVEQIDVDKIIYSRLLFDIVNKEINSNLLKNLQLLNSDLYRIISKLSEISLINSLDPNIAENINRVNNNEATLEILLRNTPNDSDFILRLTEGNLGRDEYIKYFADNIDMFNTVLDSEFIPRNLKQNLLDGLKKFKIDAIKSAERSTLITYDNLNNILSTFDELILKIEEKPITFILDTIDKITNKFFGFSSNEVISQIEKLINESSDPDNIQFSQDTIDKLDKIFKASLMYRSSIVAAVKDDINVNNVFSYNLLSNELQKTNLLTIDYNTANLLLKESSLLENLIAMYKNIYTALENRKISVHERIGTKMNIAFYKKVKSFTEMIPDDWKKDKLVNAINGSHLLETLTDEKITLDAKDKVAFEQETLNLFSSIFEFFKDNEANATDYVKLSKLINTKNFKVDSERSVITGDKDLNFDDRTFLHILMCAGSLNIKSFEKYYKEVIRSLKGLKIVPLTTLKLAIFMAVTLILNPKSIETFTKAYNHTINIDKYGQYYIYNPFVMIDASAGAGKSDAVIPLAIKVATLMDKNILNKVYHINTSKERAQKVLDDYKIDGKPHDVISFMQLFFPNYNIVRDSLGKVKTNPESYINENGIIKYDLELKENSETPSLLIVDESARLCLEDFDLIKKLCDKFGTRVIFAGDLVLSGIVSDPFKLPGLNFDIISNVSAYSFVATPRLAISFRADNNLKLYNNNILAVNTKNIESSNKIDLILLKYNLLDNGNILGDKIEILDSFGKEQLEEIIKFLNYIKLSGLKVGFIYQDESSPIYQFLSKQPKDLINPENFRKGNSSLGEELDFYIIDYFNSLWGQNVASESFNKSLYTSITRSKKGSLVLLPNFTGSDYLFRESIHDDYVISISGLSEDTINRLLDNYIELSDKLETVDDVLLLGEMEIKPILAKKEIHETLGLVNEEEERKKLVELSKTKKVSYKSLLKTKTTNDTKHGYKYTDEVTLLSIYTVMTNEVGGDIYTESGVKKIKLDQQLIRDENGNEVTASSVRRDGVNGLRKIAEILGLNKDKYLDAKITWDILNNIKSAVEKAETKNELLVDLLKILESEFGQFINNDIYATFALVTRQKWDNSRRLPYLNRTDAYQYKRFAKSPDEKLMNLYRGDENDRINALLSSINIIIGTSEHGDLLEVPIMKLTNPETYAKLAEFDKNEKFNKIDLKCIELSKKSIDAVLDYLYLEVLSKPNESEPELMTYAKLWNVFGMLSNLCIPLFDNEWVPRSMFKSLGPILTMDRALEYIWTRSLNYNAKWENISDLLSDSDLSFSSIIVGSKDIPELNIVKGRPFILVGDSLLKSDLLLIETFKNEINNENKRVSIFYIQKPFAEIKDYFLWLYDSRNNYTKDLVKVGDRFTSFKIFLVLGDKVDQFISQNKKSEWLKFKYFIDEINKIESPEIRELKTIDLLTSDCTIEGHKTGKDGYPIKLYTAFDSFLYDIVFGKHQNRSNIDEIINGNVVKRISKELVNSGFNKIPYEPELKATGEGGTADLGLGLIFIKTGDTDKYSLKLHTGEELPFKIYGKLDSTEFYGNITPLLNEILLKTRRWLPDGFSSYQFADNTLFTQKHYTKYNSKLEETPEIFVNPNLKLEFGYEKLEALNNLRERKDVLFFEADNGLIEVFKYEKGDRNFELSEKTDNFVKFKLTDSEGNVEELLYARKTFVEEDKTFKKGELYRIEKQIKNNEETFGINFDNVDLELVKLLTVLLRDFLSEYGYDESLINELELNPISLLQEIKDVFGLSGEEIYQSVIKKINENNIYNDLKVTYDSSKDKEGESCAFINISKY